MTLVSSFFFSFGRGVGWGEVVFLERSGVLPIVRSLLLSSFPLAIARTLFSSHCSLLPLLPPSFSLTPLSPTLSLRFRHLFSFSLSLLSPFDRAVR